MDVAAGTEMGSAPFPRSRTAASLRRIALPEALGRVAAISLVIAVLIFAGLTLQMSLGADPALGPKASGPATAAATQGSRVAATATRTDETSAISAALAQQAQLPTPVQASAPTPAPSVVANPSPPPTPVRTSTS
jgi:hypothetical protein